MLAHLPQIYVQETDIGSAINVSTLLENETSKSILQWFYSFDSYLGFLGGLIFLGNVHVHIVYIFTTHSLVGT